MSSQAERIKAFRHAQCTRLMKQEEEAWISGEELYTEGSSDEESNNSKTKINKGTPRKKQSIRPSTCDTEYSNSSSNISDKSDDNTETISDDKICSEKQRFDENFEWRPKRGSLQLPSMSEVVNGALFYESEVFYQEMTHSLKTLKEDFKENNKSEEPVKLSCSEENIDDQQDVKSMLSSSAELDRKINETCELWQQLKVETLGLQKEICSVIEHSGSIEERKSLNCLRSHVVNDDSASPKPGDKESSVTVTKTSTKQTNADRKFIERNIELAKQGNMATYSLTDEEKTKLEELLEDLDSEEYAFEEQDNDPEAEHITKSDDDEADIQIDSERNALNHFKLTKEDEQKMTELEAQMEELLSAYPEKLKPSCFDGEKGDPLKSADKSGRLWKFSELDERLKSIDRELKELLRKDAIETENVINANQAKGQEEVEVGGDEQN